MLSALAWALLAGPAPDEQSSPAEVLRWQWLAQAPTGEAWTWEAARLALHERPGERIGGDRALNLGIRAAPVWLRLEVPSGDARWLAVGLPWLDHVDWRLFVGGHLKSEGSGGALAVPASRRVPGLGLAVPVPPLSEPGELLLRIATEEPMVLRASWLTSDQLAQAELAQTRRHALLYGYLGALTLLSLLVAVALNERLALYYAGYLAAFALAHLGYTGQGLAWFWGPGVQRHAIGVGMILFATFGPLFMLRLLALRRQLPGIWRGSRLLLGLMVIVMAVLAALGWSRAEMQWAFGAAGLVAVMALALRAVILWRVPSTRTYLIVASLGGIGGGGITAAATWGWIAFTESRWRVVEWGLAIEALLLGLALADAIRLRRRDELHVREQARRDPLTGLLNRRAFHVDAQQACQQAARSGRPMCLFILDIDHFKQINDVHGHDIGDRALVAVAEALDAGRRDSDIVARWGGEEFVVLLPQTDATEALAVAEALRERLQQLHVALEDGGTLRLSASFGLARQDSGQALEALVRCADQRLLRAKRDGRNRVIAQDDDTVALSRRSGEAD